ncbi:hypothetical protein LUZ63_008649 [Rhynchospora breviuscula]|uniref:KIB1-4 beta-propeller domain-containing protein n=1 Tax=Rhynchospora breviuscula TaxID=2022672 RepID=A0A9Q0HVK3_9POAL|nr:hypothetical protein LUZ63_008649 [Rhynchospora breviuscula]
MRYQIRTTIKSALKKIMKKKEIEEEEIENACNWGDFPLDIFPLILNKLPDIGDFIRFRAACRPWRLYTSLSDLPSQFPWLVELYKGPDMHFCSIPYGKAYSTRTHSTYGKELFGRASCVYMIACQVQYYASNADHVSLVNPLNNHEVPLPALKYDFHAHLRFLTNISWICPSSFKNDDYVIVTDRAKRLAVCKIGDDSRWDIIGSASMKRCFYLKGLLFMLDLQTGVTEVMDIASRKVLYVIQLPESEIFSFSVIPHLVESCEEILAVFRHPSSDSSEVYRFDIYRLELGNGEGYPCCIKVRSIGDRILFLDFSTAHGFCLSENDFGLFRSGNFTTNFTNLFHHYTRHTHGHSLSLRASVPGFKCNCIYFRDRKDLRFAHVIAMYDIEKGQTFVTDSLFNGDDNIVTRYMPTLNHI